MIEELRRIAHELRTYNPAADEYKGEHIHKVWAREIEAVLASVSGKHGEQTKLEFMTVDSMQHAIVYGSTEAIAALKARMERDYRAASTSANVDRFDPYRLKVAEECCERLMSACTDAGCPDGVRMDDWIRENVRSTSANVAQGAVAVGLVMTNDKGEKYGALLDSNIEERTKLYVAPPAQTALADDALDAARYRWLRDRTDTRDQKPFIAIMSAGGISMWNDTSADDAIDAALTAAQSGDKS